VNEAQALSLQRVGVLGLGELLPFIGIPSKRKSAGRVPSEIETILESITKILDELLLTAIGAKTCQEFRRTREKVFGRYFSAVKALSDLVHVMLPNQIVERLTSQSFCELEAEFRDQGLARFGPAAKEQALFTIWTLRRTSGLISKIAEAGSVPENLKNQDAKLASEFAYHAAWAQFHLDCLLAASRFDKIIQLDVMPAIIDGLRAAVNAYGYGRQGLHLRTPEPESQLSLHQWDEEDQELLDSSMRDMEEIHAIDD
jgi:hypothetical protein